MSYEHILYAVDDGVATITLNRPERLNALTPTMRRELLEAALASEEDPEVRAVIVTGAGRGFCSGGDVKAMQEANEKRQSNPLEERMAPIRDRVLLAIHQSSKPYIAAVNGPAAGAGFSIALGCDIRIAADNARFGMTFSRRGLHPDWGGTYFLPRIVGAAKAAELIWSGNMIAAEEAKQLGIVSYLAQPDELMASATTMARNFAAGPPIAIRMAKRSIYHNMECGLREALEFETFAQNICAGTADAKEGIKAFNEKREPVFSGE